MLTESGMVALVAGAGFKPTDPVLVAVRRRRGRALVVVQGQVDAYAHLSMSTQVYTASLSKQFTAACAALLAREGRLDLEAPLTDWLPDLPMWAESVRLRHLIHHTGGLPSEGDLDGDRTTEAVLKALNKPLRHPPGTAFEYSNAGYVCLARVLEVAAGQPLPDLARNLLFDPLGMEETLFWPGPDPTPPKGVRLNPAPLSLGDGGAWSTASDLLRWGTALNDGALDVTTMLQTAGTLDDGRPLDYGWGQGIRDHAGHPLYRHGGGWPGIRLLLARVPDLGLTALVIALATDDRHIALLDALLAGAASPGRP